MAERKFPIGIQTFEVIRRERMVYVDKTAKVFRLTHGMKYHFLSRPRRFGKTFATNMLCAYYSKGCDSREMFQNLKISQ